MQKEASLSKKICTKLEATFEKCKAEKSHGSPMGRCELDIRGAVNGIAFEFEVKLPGEKPTPRQFHRIRELEGVGIVTGWVDNVDDAILLIKTGVENFKARMKE